MKKTSYKSVYNRKNKLNAKGKALVQVECYLSGKRKYISTGIRIEPVYWSKKFNLVKNNHPDYIELNRLIEQQIRNLQDFEYKQIEKNGFFSLNEISGFVVENSHIHDDFIKFCKNNITNNVALSSNTKRHQNTTINKLEEFSRNVSFNDLSYDFVKMFDDFLRNKGLHINTVATHHKVLKTYINVAIKKDLISPNSYPYKFFKVKLIATKKTFLTLEELEQISKIEFSKETLRIEQVRDMFLFSSYTGLRFGDMQTLKNKDIDKKDGDYIIEIRMNKTKDFVKLPISLMFKGKAVEVVKKYEDDDADKLLFPRISNQKANDKLKLIALMGKISKNLTFHVSRHSFGTNIASATSDQFLIKELMGHANIKTSMNYIHISQEQIRNKLKNTNWD